MGIVNVTPDSFSDGGQFATTAAALAHGLRLVEQGADLLDVGGESSRPGAEPLDGAQVLARVLPVVEGLVAQASVPISVDTYKAETAGSACKLGRPLWNDDITALRGDADMAEVVRSFGAGVVLMHMQGTPATMQTAPHYVDVVSEVRQFFQERLQESARRGIGIKQVVFDPGIGFGKKASHNLGLLARLRSFQDLGRPIMLGVSRKGLLGRLLDRPVDQRLAGSLAVACDAVSQGAAQIVRVHDVRETRDAVTTLTALLHYRQL